MKFRRKDYQQIIEDDRAWLLQQPDTLERSHIDAIVLCSEQREYDVPETIRQLRERVSELETALQDLMSGVGGHNHWDREGTSGANCPLCIETGEAKSKAREVLEKTP